ncbi:MAG: aminoglycoside phosphotransferase family protein [Haloarculaceae archaeon]
MSDVGELTAETAGAYLRDRGVVPAQARVETRSLGGGVSNRVVEVRWDGECLVAKQPLANLAVGADWPADVDRVHNEAAAARAYANAVASADLDARVPAVGYENRSDHVVAFECAPAGATTWKRELLDGTVDRTVAVTLGRVLGAVQRAAAGDDELRETFASERPFEQLRLDPYHRTVAERHSDVAGAIAAEVDRVTGVKRTLVHGDYSPKNVLVDRADGAVPWVIDFEVAHWGDPAFDAAFMLNHLFIKSVYHHEARSEYVDAAFAFWEAYDERVPWDVERATVAELGVLMLARVDGKSPVEYVDEGAVADALRATAKRALRDEVETLGGFAAAAREAGETL